MIKRVISVSIEKPTNESLTMAALAIEEPGLVAIRFEVLEAGSRVSRNLVFLRGGLEGVLPPHNIGNLILLEYKYYSPVFQRVVIHAYY